MKKNEISSKELKSWLDEKKDFALVDVMNPEYFAEKHITGAVNAPVYEVVFLTYLEKLEISKEKTIVVYSHNKDSLAVADAIGKLTKAGYVNLFEFSEGLVGWEEAEYPIEKGTKVEAPIVADGEYGLDIENSLVGWSGRNAKYAHHGKITLKSGSILVEDGKVIGGKIVLDMTTIKDDDLADDMWRGVLESHLKSSDFFDTEKFNEASFEFADAKLIEKALNGTPNYKLRGNLIIKDVKREIEFPAIIMPMGDGVLNGQAHFDFDRTLWNVRYGSEKFFEKLGMHLVNDIVSLEMFLVAKK